MRLAKLQAVHPIVGARELERTLIFYVEKLGFSVAFSDGSQPTNYAGLRRGDVELHFQFQFEHEMQTTRLRLLVDDPDALFEEYLAKGVVPAAASPANTPWGTREFAFYDPRGTR